MATVISVINWKGGVGKTTTTVALAEMLASGFGKHVLVVDLDPQTNSTLMLIGQDRWKRAEADRLTLADAFEDELLRAQPSDAGAILQNTRSLNGSVDLLPSSPRLIKTQDYFGFVLHDGTTNLDRVRALKRITDGLIHKYNYVLIDCPPNLGVLSLNGLLVSDGYLMPTIPDHLSTYGIHLIVDRVEEFGRAIGRSISPYGVVVNKFKTGVRLHMTTIDDLRRSPVVPVLIEPYIRETIAIADAAEFDSSVRTFGKRWGFDQVHPYRQLTEAVMKVSRRGMAMGATA